MYDDEKTDLLKHWDNTYKYISKARSDGSKVLVHCKMGVSRSASVVIAYAMKAFNWDFQTALNHVKEKRSCIKPNSSFISQLETYQGILDAMKNKEKLQRSKSETNLKSPVQIKNGRLAGNVPPPVIQIPTQGNDEETSSSGQDLRQIGERPKSWSPDNSIILIEDSQNVFLSLENLNQRSVSKDSLKSLRQKCLDKNPHADSENTNVLLPCDNGESYSVSPNQIRHLPGQHNDTEHTSVKDRINELESQKLKNVNKKKLVLNVSPQLDSEVKTDSIKVIEQCTFHSSLNSVNEDAQMKLSPQMRRAISVKTEIWDPGEKTSNKRAHCNCTTESVCDCQHSVSDKQTKCSFSNSLKNGLNVSTNVKVPDLNCGKAKNLSTKTSDLFSNQLDRVFDKEERKQQRKSVAISTSHDFIPEELLRECPSRQNSWGSCDSAVVLGYQSETRETPSRHSSWGSGDTRTLPSRNSSWGSYDMRQNGSTGYVNEKGEKIANDVETNPSGLFSYDKEDIPWYPGTVKRTKQRLEECAGKKNVETADVCDLFESKIKSSSSDTLTSDYPASIISQNENNVEAFNTILIKNHRNDTSSSNIAILPVPRAIYTKSNLVSDTEKPRLSVSAPESSSMDFIVKECSLSRSASNVSTIEKDLKEQKTQYSKVKKHKIFSENFNKNFIKRSSLEEQSGNILGLVRSRKKEFEAKTNVDRINQNNTEIISDNAKCKNRVNSLPSSPISIPVDKEFVKEDVSSSSDPGEDVKLKQLIGKFEYGKTDENNTDTQVNLRQKTNKSFLFKNVRNSSVDKNCITPFISSFNNKHCSVTDKNIESGCKRPPMAPVVRNTQPNVVVTNVITKSNKKQQQFGKTHPLAKLNYKQRHNNPVYNTM